MQKERKKQNERIEIQNEKMISHALHSNNLPNLSADGEKKFRGILGVIIYEDPTDNHIDIESIFFVYSRLFKVICSDLKDGDVVNLASNPTMAEFEKITQEQLIWPLWLRLIKWLTYGEHQFDGLRRYGWLVGLQYYIEEYNNASITKNGLFLAQYKKYVSKIFETSITDPHILKEIRTQVSTLRKSVDKNLATSRTFGSSLDLIQKPYFELTIINSPINERY